MDIPYISARAIVNLIIPSLKKKGINKISFTEINKNFFDYISLEELPKGFQKRKFDFSNYKKLFEEAGIEIYDFNSMKREKKLKKVENALKYFKEDLKKDLITVKELQEYLYEKHNEKFYANASMISSKEIKTFMNKIKISFLNNDEKRKKSLSIIEKFSKSEIVNQYKKENKNFSILDIHKHIKDEITKPSLYNYSEDIIRLGIPLKETRLLKNNRQLDEQGIIDKLCEYMKKRGIDEEYAGAISSFSKRISLKKISKENILRYKDYILKEYGIKVLDVNDKKVKKLSNTIEDNKKYLINKREARVKIVEKLPLYINDNDVDLCILNEKHFILKDLWNHYLEFYIKKLSENRVNVRNELLKDMQINIKTENKKIFFLLHEKLHISSLSIEDIIHLSLKEVLSSEKQYGIHRQNMFIGFLIYLFSKEILIFSIEFVIENYYKKKKVQSELPFLHKSNKIITGFKKLLKENRLGKKEIDDQRLFLFFITSLNYKIKISEINDNMFKSIDIFDEKLSKRLKKVFIKLGSRLNISSHKRKFTDAYYKYMEVEAYKELINISTKYMDRKVKLKETKTPKAYYRVTSSKISHFLDFITFNHNGMQLNRHNLEKVFDYPESTILTYQEYVDSLDIQGGSKTSKISIFVEIFSNTKGYDGICTKEKIPRYISKPSRRVPIDEDEIIHKLDDIVTNRPPKSNYFRNYSVNMDMSWWEHLDRVRPFEPLIIKLHLRIPVRGETLRLTDRDKILQYNKNGNIKGFYFVSDKNKKRRDPLVVPNIWKSELLFLEKLVEYSKEYAPNIPRVYPDDSTLKEGIIPLFCDSEGLSTYTSQQHLLYWTKVLIQAQMEFLQEGKDYNLVYSTNIELPKSISELDSLSSEEITTFKRKYDIHSLRHTGITRNIRAGMPLELVRMLSGHSGYNTILTIYYHVNQDELINNWLNKHNLDITDELNLNKNSNLFLKKEMIADEIKSTNPKQLLKVLEDNCFFQLSNRTLSIDEDVSLESISESDPKFWKSRSAGICTRMQCHDKIIERCSLCPYLISNYMFLEDIGLKVQLSMIKIQKFNDLIIKNRESGHNHENSRLKTLVKEQIEEFVGWLEVLDQANTSYKEYIHIKNNKHNSKNPNNLECHNESNKSVDDKPIYGMIPSINIDHGYLETLVQSYKRVNDDNETIFDISNIIANKLIRYHAQNNTFHEIENLTNEQIVLSFLPKYEKLSQTWHYNLEDRKQLELLLNMLEDKNKKLEYKNENTFLPK